MGHFPPPLRPTVLTKTADLRSQCQTVTARHYHRAISGCGSYHPTQRGDYLPHGGTYSFSRATTLNRSPLAHKVRRLSSRDYSPLYAHTSSRATPNRTQDRRWFHWVLDQGASPSILRLPAAYRIHRLFGHRRRQ